MALWILPPLLLLGAPPSTEAVAGNSSDLMLRASGVTCNVNKTLAWFDTTARFYKKTDKTFCGWFSAAANVPTAHDSMHRGVADDSGQVKPPGLEDCRPNESLKQPTAVGWTFHDVWDGMKTELHLEESDRQLEGAICSRAVGTPGGNETEPPGLHQEMLLGGARLVPRAEVGPCLWEGEQEFGWMGWKLGNQVLHTLIEAKVRVGRAVMLGKEILASGTGWKLSALDPQVSPQAQSQAQTMRQWMHKLGTAAAILLAGVVYMKTQRRIRQHHGRTWMCPKTLPKQLICTNSPDAQLKPGHIWVQMMHQSLEINPTSWWADQDDEEVIHPLIQHTLRGSLERKSSPYHVLVPSQQAQSHPKCHHTARTTVPKFNTSRQCTGLHCTEQSEIGPQASSASTILNHTTMSHSPSFTLDCPFSSFFAD